jgi:hypothetical protein
MDYMVGISIKSGTQHLEQIVRHVNFNIISQMLQQYDISK